jgi:hypothetical protein
MGEDRPSNARMLGGERHGSDIHMPTLLQPSCPLSFGVRLLVDDTQMCAGAVHQERSQVAIALTRDLPEPFFAATRVLPRSDAQPRREASPILEDFGIAHRGDERRRRLRSDRLDAHQPSRRLTGLGERADLAVVSANARIRLMKLLK